MVGQDMLYPFDILRKLSLNTGLLIETRQFAEHLDTIDELRTYRKEFYFPKNKTIIDVDLSLVSPDDDSIYLAGMSLGLFSKNAHKLMDEEMQKWQDCGVYGHSTGKRPWKLIAEFAIDQTAKLVGAKPIEIVVMNSLSTNLHFMLTSFYRPTQIRHKILIEHNAFPSDHIAAQSQIEINGFNPKTDLIIVKPREGEETLRIEDILSVIASVGEEISVILFSGVQYYTGQYFDLRKITAAGHAKGCKVGFDLAHAVGNVELKLHEWDVDFACWCTYKYLNGGPGATAAAFVHEKFSYDENLKRLTGWWGVELKERFEMNNEKLPVIPGARGFACSNPPLFSTMPVIASLEIFDKVGMDRFIKKQRLLTGYLEYLIKSNFSAPTSDYMNQYGCTINIITPEDIHSRGCQLSLTFSRNIGPVYSELTKRGVVCDKRLPRVLRVSPMPLYNSYLDVFRFVEALSQTLLFLKQHAEMD